MFVFVVMLFSVLNQEIGWEDHLWNDLHLSCEMKNLQSI